MQIHKSLIRQRRAFRRVLYPLFALTTSWLFVLALVSPAFAVTPQDTYSWVKNIGTSGCPPQSGRTQGIAVVGSKVYVTNTNAQQVRIYNTSGSTLLGFGSQGTGNGQFQRPAAVAVDSSGDIYVVDTSNNTVQKFDASGTYLSQFGSQGSGDGQFDMWVGQAWSGIAINPSNGNLYVADGGNNRIEVFSPSGTYLSQFSATAGSTGSAQLNTPAGLAFDASGNLYAVDTGNNRIVKFDANGTYISDFGSYGNGNGQFGQPSAVAIDPTTGDLYVTDTSNYRVQKFDASGTYLSQFGSQGSSNGQFQYPLGVAVDSSGNVYVTDQSSNTADVQKFDSNGTFVTNFTYQPAGVGPNSLCIPWGIARDSSGNIYVVNQVRRQVNKYSPSGTLLGTIGTPASEQSQPVPGDLSGPFGVAVDSAGNVYVTDMYMGLQKFDANGNFVATIGNLSIMDGSTTVPTSVAVDAAGNVYVTNVDLQGTTANVQKYDANGNKVLEFGSAGTGDGQFLMPYGSLAVDTNGSIYVPDLITGRVQKFDANGNYISQLGSQGTGPGQFQGPVAVTIDASGNIFVSDVNPNNGQNGRVEKFAADGTFLSEINSPGSADGQFNTPTGLVTDLDGNLYISDMAGGSSQSGIISVWHAPIAPSVPLSATTSAPTANSLKVSWQAPAHGTAPLTSYTVRYRVHGSNAAWQTVTLSGTTLSTTLTGLTASTTYDIEVTATNAIGTSVAATTSGTTTAASSNGGSSSGNSSSSSVGAPNTGLEVAKRIAKTAGLPILASLAVVALAWGAWQLTRRKRRMHF